MRSHPTSTTTLTLALAGGFVGSSGPAHAYDAATTHAGLTQQAASASHLHQVLTTRLGRSLGLFDLVRLRTSDVPEEARSLWHSRLAMLDAGSGYRPDANGKQAAIAWVLAGAVLTHAPAERARLSFLDPSTGRGLAEDGGTADSVATILDQASLRGVVTGAAARREAPSAWDWVSSPGNDEGLPSFELHLAEAVTSAAPEVRESALARALISLGGVLGVLEDMGEPAHVRNDLERAFLSDAQGEGHAGPFNRGSRYERWVADRYGTSGVPAAGSPVAREDVKSFFVSPDGNGLANRTQRRFFSVGTVPLDQVLTSLSNQREATLAAQSSLTYALPAVSGLALRSPGEAHYVVENEGGRTLKKLGYRLEPGHLRFFLDERVFADAAAVLLPETGAFAAGLIDFLFRAEVALNREDGLIKATVTGTKGTLKQATLTLLSEDDQGQRTVIGTFADVDAASVPVPPGAHRLVAWLRGADQSGSLVATGTLSLAPAPAPSSAALAPSPAAPVPSLAK